MSDVDSAAAPGEPRPAKNVQHALYRIAELASAARDLQEFYRAVHAVVGDLMYANNLFIALYDDERQLICWPYFVDEVDLDVPDPNRWDAFGEGDARGTTAYVLRTGAPQLLGHKRMEELVEQGEIEIVGVTTVDASWLGVPLKAEERTIGALVVQSYTRDVQYTEQDRDLLAFVGQHVGAALSRARAIEETRQRNAELALINSVQEALAGELELQAIYEVVGDKIQEVFDAQVVDIGMYDEMSGLIQFPYTFERGVRRSDEPMPLIGFRKHVMESREPLMLGETTPEVTERYGNPFVLVGEPSKSVLFVPLLVGGRATGVISLQNLDREHAFTADDQRLLTTLAQSLSVALENARLVHETRQRNAELALINSVQESIAGELDLQAIYDLVGDKLQEVFDAQVVDIGIYDFESGLTRYPYTIERGVRFPDEPTPMTGSPTSQMLLETRMPVLLNDIPAWERERGEALPVLQGEPALAMLLVPLIVGDEIKGRISLQNLDRANAFSEYDVRLLSTLAGSLSAALENARLMHETQLRNAELALINSVQAAIAGELEPQRIFDLVGEKIEEVYDAQVVSISTYDEASGLLSFPYMVERGERFELDPMPVVGFRKHVLESAEPLMINEGVVAAAERYGNPLVLAGEVPKSVLFVPLFTGGKPSGVISLQNVDREHAFSDSDRSLLLTLAGSISAGLENARLVQETQQRNAELALINSVQEAIAGELDQQAIYDVVGEKLRDVFDAQVVSISVYDQSTGMLTFPYVIERGERLHEEPMELIGFRKHVMETREPLMINEDVDAAAERYGNPRVLSGEPVKSSVFVPLVAGGKATGVVSLQNVDREHAFTASDLGVLTTLCGSLSVALDNARLVHETRERATDLATVNSVSEALASQLDLDALIELVGERVRETFDADIAYVALHDEAAGRIEFPYYHELGGPRHEPPLEYGEGITSRILASGQPLLLNRKVDYEGLAMLGTPSRSYLGVPIVTGERAIGVISVQSTEEEGRFDESDARLLSTIAANVGVAIQNARLYLETRRRANEMAALAEVGREVSATLNLSVVLNRIGERAHDLLEVDTSAVFLSDDDGETLRATVALGKDADQMFAHTIAVGTGIIGDLAARGAAEFVNDTGSDPRAVTVPGTSDQDLGGLMAAPLLARERVIGMMAVWRYASSPFSAEELSFLVGLSQQAAIAIENARLFEEQREAEQKYRELVEQLPLTVYRDLPDVSATSEYISPRVETMFGYPAEAWLDSEFFLSVLHPDDRDRVLAEQEEWLTGNVERWTNEYRVLAADGRTVWVRDDAWLVKDAEGNPSRIHGFMIDVTEETLAHGEIRRQKQYFESLVDVSPVAIVVMDAHERVSGWNPAAAELFGWSADEAVGKQIDDLVFHEGEREEGRATTRDALETGRAQRIGRRTRRDGGTVDVELMLVPLRVDDEHVGFYAIYHDITELQRAREEAEAATQAKGAFLATMSHEIRTPMNAVIGMTDLLLGTDLSDDQREFAEVVRSSGDALLHVIDDILDYSKIEAGKFELEREPFDLRECIEGALEIVAPRASAKDIELGCLIDEDAPAGIVGDASRLRQVLLNLLSNAVKFTEQGEVVVHVDAEPMPQGGYRLALAVRDTGIGIPHDRMDRLFTSFSQIDASTTRRYGGTGLGLAISKRLVELMGGTISVESEEGVGSTFHISLSTRAAEVPARISAHDAIPRLAGKRVLVVDDNATNREIVSRHARSWGMEPVAVERPVEALALVERGESFDVAVLDMMMPDMDGIALAREIRRHRTERELPLLLLTSLGRLPQARSTDAFSAQLAKPVKASQLYNALVRLVAAGTEEGEAAEVPAGGRPKTSSLRILLAEDNAVNQKVALRLLERLGYGADVASNGLEAIEELERRQYDVVLMDVQMPELDGLAASRRICERWPVESRPRIIAMTANALPEDRDACFAAGMDDYLAKPIRPDELAQALGRAIPLRKETDVREDDDGAGFDEAAIDSLRELGGDDFVAEVIDTFLADAPTLLATMRTALADGRTDELRRAAHTLKSNGATFGADGFAELCRELEELAKKGELEYAPGLVERIDHAYEPLQKALATLRSRTAAA